MARSLYSPPPPVAERQLIVSTLPVTPTSGAAKLQVPRHRTPHQPCRDLLASHTFHGAVTVPTACSPPAVDRQPRFIQPKTRFFFLSPVNLTPRSDKSPQQSILTTENSFLNASL